MTSSRRTLALAAMLGVALAGAARAQRPVDPAALEHWRSLRFGMFVHWGPVALTGREIGWSRGAPTPIDEYDRLHERFDPVEFDADAWVAAARDAGMRYVVLTTKHHDGFCMWPSAQTDFDIASTPFGRDVVGELASACRRGGLEFGTYYSVPDWHHPDYPKGSPHGRTDKPGARPERYADYLRAQVRELVVGYGPLLTMWFDMPREFGPDDGIPVVDMLRELQPDIVVNNRAYTGEGRTGAFPGQRAVGDYDTPEQRVGTFQRDRAWETCMTLCRQWSWKPDDTMKSLDECVGVLVRTIGGDGNLLLNVGPLPDGRIEPRQVERLRELGTWVARHAAGIYGTRGGPFLPGRYGATTCAGPRVFVFVLDPTTAQLRLPALPARVLGAADVDGGSVDFEVGDDSLRIALPDACRTPPGSYVVLTLDTDAFGLTPVPVPAEPSGSLAFGCAARASNTFQGLEQFGPQRAFDDDPDTRWATDAGTSAAWLAVDLGAPRRVARVVVDEAEPYVRIRRFELEVSDDGAAWRAVHRGDGVGPALVIELEPVVARQVRLRVLEASDGPTIRELQVFGVPPTGTSAAPEAPSGRR
ncbi:MAG: alpha-L-fucosidase [Planctomycetes bacterium]|nr:alpha-L-fucosidase [Planctomycetota bacterium]